MCLIKSYSSREGSVAGWEVRGSSPHKASQLEIPESLNGSPNQATMAGAPCLLGQKGSVAIVQTHTHTHAETHTPTRNACSTAGMDVVLWWRHPRGQFGKSGGLKRAFHCLSHGTHTFMHSQSHAHTHTHTHTGADTHSFPSILKLKGFSLVMFRRSREFAFCLLICRPVIPPAAQRSFSIFVCKTFSARNIFWCLSEAAAG